MAMFETGLGYREMKAAVMTLLEEKRAVTLKEFEDHLFALFHKKWEEGAYDTLEGKKRLRWENFTDHVKANLTKEDFTHKVDVLDTLYLCHTPQRGFLQDEGGLVLWSEHRTTLLMLAKRISQEVTED
jgi:hypothetical protein